MQQTQTQQQRDDWPRAAGLPTFEDYLQAIAWALIFNERHDPHQLEVAGSVGDRTKSYVHRTNPNVQ